MLTTRDKAGPVQEAGTETSSYSWDLERAIALVKGRKLKNSPSWQKEKEVWMLGFVGSGDS